MYKRLKEKIKNYPMKKKLSVSFSIVIVLPILLTILIINALNYISNRTAALYDGPYAISDTIATMRVSLQKLDKNMYKAISTTDLTKRHGFLAEAADDECKFRDNLEILKSVSAGDQALLDALSNSIAEASSSRNEIVDFLEKNDIDSATKAIEGAYSYQIEDTKNNIVRIYQSSQVKAKSFVDTSDTFRDIAIGIILVMMSLVVLLSIIVGKILREVLLEGINNVKNISQNLLSGNLKDVKNEYKSKDEMGEMSQDLIDSLNILSSQINNMTNVLGSLSNGDLTVELDNSITYNGDFAPIKTSLKNIIDSLNSNLFDVHELIYLTASSSEQISSTTQVLAEGSTEQASSVEELFASFSEILEQVKKNADNAKKVNDFSCNTKDIVAEGNDKMNELMVSIKEISNSSKKIAAIIKTIESIASQTNLLSLNAAIEASKAGEYGKGFAVVAKEIKVLANQSADAVKTTTDIIENSLVAISNGEALAKETANSLNVIVKNVDDTADLIEEIATASQIQTESISQMTAGVDRISDVVQTTSATAEETAAATQELATQTQLINEKLSQYKLQVQKKK